MVLGEKPYPPFPADVVNIRDVVWLIPVAHNECTHTADRILEVFR